MMFGDPARERSRRGRNGWFEPRRRQSQHPPRTVSNFGPISARECSEELPRSRSRRCLLERCWGEPACIRYFRALSWGLEVRRLRTLCAASPMVMILRKCHRAKMCSSRGTSAVCKRFVYMSPNVVVPVTRSPKCSSARMASSSFVNLGILLPVAFFMSLNRNQ